MRSVAPVEHIPLEQGLRLILVHAGYPVVAPVEHIPLEQGLRPAGMVN